MFEQIKKYYLERYMQHNVNSSTIYDSQDMEEAQEL